MFREVLLGDGSLFMCVTVSTSDDHIDLHKLVTGLEEDAMYYLNVLNTLSVSTKDTLLQIANKYDLWSLFETGTFNSYSPKFMAIMALIQIAVNKELCKSLDVIDRDYNELLTAAKEYNLQGTGSYIVIVDTEGMIRTAMTYELRRKKLLGEDVSELESTLGERIKEKVDEGKLRILLKLLSIVNQSYHHPHLLSR